MSNKYLITVGDSDKTRMDAMCRVFNGPTLEILLKYPAKSFLDIGCVNGGLTSVYAASNPDVRCVGVDRAPEQLEIAKTRGQLPNLTYEVGDVHNLRESLGKFDIVFTRFLLTHLKTDNVRTTAKSLMRFVNPGGVLIMIEANGGAGTFSKVHRAAIAWKAAFTTQHVMQGSSLETATLLKSEFPEAEVVEITGKFDSAEKKTAMSEGVRLACKILGSGAKIPPQLNPLTEFGGTPDDWIREVDELVSDPDFTFEMNPTAVIVKG